VSATLRPSATSTSLDLLYNRGSGNFVGRPAESGIESATSCDQSESEIGIDLWRLSVGVRSWYTGATAELP